MKTIAKMNNHAIICGCGRTGKEALSQLMDMNFPVVIIEKDPAIFEQLPKKVVKILGDAQQEAELQNAYLQQENEVLGELGKDPLVDLKKQELALRQQEQQQDAQQDQAENMLDQMRIDQQAQLARERIASTEEIANMRAQIALQRTANRGGN